MILDKYIFKEILKAQVVTLIILLTVFISQSIIRLASKAAVGSIPADIVAYLAIYSLPDISVIMLPLTLFIAILITLGRICSDSEMVVMRSVGFSPLRVLKLTIFLSIVTAIVSGFLSIDLSSRAANARAELLHKAKTSPEYLPLESGRFINFGNYNIYVEQVKNDQNNQNVQNVYVLTLPLKGQESSVTAANEGYLQTDDNGIQWLYLKHGNRFEGPLLKDGSVRVAYFEDFKAPVAVDTSVNATNVDIAQMSTSDLLASNSIQAQVEAQWRFSSIFAAIVLSIIAVPLSMVNPRQGRFARLLPAILIYTAYYLFLLSIRNMVLSARLPLFPGLYIVPVLFFILVAIPLNIPAEVIKKFIKKAKK